MSALEKHLTIPEIAELWNLTPDTVRQIFRNEPGVLRISRPETLHKRGYVSLRVPESVVQRVHQARSKAVARG